MKIGDLRKIFNRIFNLYKIHSYEKLIYYMLFKKRQIVLNFYQTNRIVALHGKVAFYF